MHSLKIIGAVLTVLFLALTAEATYRNNNCYHENCHSGAKFNWQTCSCEGAAKPVKPKQASSFKFSMQPISHNYNSATYNGPNLKLLQPVKPFQPIKPFQLPAKPSCTRQVCAPGQYFDYSICQCRCLQNTACPGALQFSQQNCRCECPFSDFINDLSCGPGQFFNTFRCRCEFLPTPPPPPPTPETPNCPRIIACSFPQSFDTNTCRCVCPRGAAESCTRAQFFNPNTCDCECSSSDRQCNELQEQNPLTCECECVAVLPLPIEIEDDDDSTPGTRSTGTGTRSTGTRSSGTRSTGTRSTRRSTRRSSSSRSRREVELEVNDLLVREKRRKSKKSKSKSGSRSSTGTGSRSSGSRSSGSRSSGGTASRTTILFNPGPAERCPAGQTLNTRTCRCF